MGVAARYVNREMASIFAVALAVLLLLAVGGRIIGYLQEAAIGKFSGTTVLVIMLYRLPEFVQLIIPFALYIAVLLTVSRLYADREMVVLQGAGTTTSKLVGWMSITGLLVVAIVALLSTFVTPLAMRSLDQYLAAQRAESQFETVNANVFQKTSGGSSVTYSEDISSDRRTLSDFFLAQDLDTEPVITVWAEAAQQQFDESTGSQFLVFHDGYRYSGTTGKSDYQVLKFEELSQRVDTADVPQEEVDVTAKPTTELSNPSIEVAELHWRIALPLFCAIGGLLALGLGHVRPRQGRFARVVPGMLMILAYYLSLLVNKNALAEDNLPSVFGMWIAHGVFVVVAVFLLRRVADPVNA